MLIFDDTEAILSSVRDISERKQFQKRILRTIIETEEKERLRFARDLHDGLGADLSSIKMYIDAIAAGHVPKEKIPAMLLEAKQLIKDAAESSREIAYNMKPHVLENFGLKEVLSKEITKINQNMEVYVNYNFDLFTVRLHKDIDLNLYRIFKELINNSMKYSQANQITVLIFNQDTNLFFSFSDNGTGFDIEKTVSNNQGNGLINIRSRVDWMGGACVFKSEIGNGFQADIKLNITDYVDITAER
jgi:signal transduction histidine kinase